MQLPLYAELLVKSPPAALRGSKTHQKPLTSHPAPVKTLRHVRITLHFGIPFFIVRPGFLGTPKNMTNLQNPPDHYLFLQSLSCRPLCPEGFHEEESNAKLLGFRLGGSGFRV